MNFDQMTVAEIAIQHPSAAHVFNKYQIDFCCGGKKPFREACEKAGVNPDEVMTELFSSETNSMPGTIRFDTWEPTLLADFIVQHHHGFVRRSIPQLYELIAKVCEAHGDRDTYLLTLRDTFTELAEELLLHMEKEEMVLFPAIKRLYEETRIPVDATPIPAHLMAPMKVMEDEHDHAGNLIKKIRTLTSSYTPPASACPTYRVTYRRLEEFDQDLMQHIHLENNVLFAKVKERLATAYSVN